MAISPAHDKDILEISKKRQAKRSTIRENACARDLRGQQQRNAADGVRKVTAGTGAQTVNMVKKSDNIRNYRI